MEEELIVAKYKITLTHKETDAKVVHYFTELKMGALLEYVAVQNKDNEYDICIEFIDKAVAYFD